ncbi:MAG: DNA primase large subunit PriL [Candidatus Thermoplasmatota archaeon]|nr:DNA primase large subunit PriL [Candidatus Thermoplasmatota archaeon]
MTDLPVLAKYPFLKESKNYVKENEISIDELLNDSIYERARLIGIERLDNAFNKRDVGNRALATDYDCIMELLSYPIARMITVCIGDIYFKRSYALSEAVHSYNYLINESTSNLIKISDEFKFNIKYDKNNKKFLIYFTDYLKNAPTRYSQWKMINRVMENGYISLSSKDFTRIIQEALRSRINNELDTRKCSKIINESFKSDIIRLSKLIEKHRKKIEIEPMGSLDENKLPPCMKEILKSIQSGENVPHMGRFAMVAFLNSLKLNTSEILQLFSTAPDFEEEKSRYQVEHISGKTSSTSYTSPGCDKMRSYGICPTEKMDELCKRYRHPLTYYKVKWRNK